VEGHSLTADPGIWNGPIRTYSFQWQRCDSSGAACSAITEAKSESYVLVAADVGKTLRVTVMASNKNGSAAATSAATAVVTGAAPAPSTPTSTSTSTTTTAAPPPPPPPPPSPEFSSSRYAYCFGDSQWSYGGSTDPGWWYEGTSTGWIRQASVSLSNRVRFDDSVTVMQSVTGSYGQLGTSGPCRTVKAEIQPTDYNANQSPSNAQRATIYAPDSNLTKLFYGSQPPVFPKSGDSWWYGFAFTTNPGYVPHYDPVYGNWNGIFAFHDSYFAGGWSPLAPFGIGVATLGPASGANEYRCGSSMAKLAEPRLEIVLTGGDRDNPNWASDGSNGTNTCRRYLGPVFRAGQLYRVMMFVKWDAYQNGALQVFVNGTKVVDVTGLSTMWRSGTNTDPGTYPIFQNYRYYDASLPVNAVYYGGLIKGSTQADVTIP
jgi:hypothetical protein